MNQFRGSGLAVPSWVYGCALLMLTLPTACGDDDDVTGNTGGKAGAGGSSAKGGAGSGGTATGTGGARGGTGGTTGKGGAETSGGAETGGTETGGTSTGGTSTGGAETGGNHTGGTSTGGNHTGGTSTGGASTGGNDTGGDAGHAGANPEGGTSSGGGGNDTGGSAEMGGSGGAGGDVNSDAGAGGGVELPLANIVGGGWITEEYADGEGAPKAFDGDPNTKWLTFNATSWIQYQFNATTTSVDSYVITSANDSPDRDPRSWVLLGNNTGPDANDADDSEWQVLDTRTEQDSFAERNTAYTFTAAHPGAYKYYRLRIDENNGDSIIQLAEIELYSGATKVTGPGHVTQQFAKNEGPEFAFDHDYATKWLTFNTTSWIQYEFPAVTHAVQGYTLVSGNDSDDRDPRDWVLLGNNAGPDDDDNSDSEWTVLDSRSAQPPFAERNQAHTFTVANPGAFKFYRFQVTANNGSSDILQLSEIELLAR
jgi:hypothetical protein